MPSYGFLNRPLSYVDMSAHLKAMRSVGVPYTDEMIANAVADVESQANPDGDTVPLLKRYGNAAVAPATGAGGKPTEMDALVAYLQVLGTMVRFEKIDIKSLKQ